MPFLRRRNPNGERDWRGALEDAIIVFFFVFLSNLAGYGYPPTLQAIYTSFLAGACVFVLAIQRRFGIEIPEKVKPLEKE